MMRRAWPSFLLMPFRSLYGQLAIVFLASLILMSLVTAWMAVSQFDQLGREWLQRTEIGLATRLADDLAPALQQGADSAAAQRAVARLYQINPAISLYVLDATGKVVGTYNSRACGLHARVPLAAVHRLLSSMPMLPIYVRLPCADRRDVFSAASIHYGPTAKPGYLFVSLEATTHLSMASMWQTSSISRSLLIAGLGALALSAALGLFLFALVTRRFSRLIRSLRYFAAGDYAQRVAPVAGDEIGQAARAFNEMAATIEAQMAALAENDRQRRELVANLSHDFRTPLTALQGYSAQLSAEPALTANHADELDAIRLNVARLTRLAEQLSTLSQADIGAHLPHIEAFPPAELVQDIVGKFRPRARQAGIELVADCAPDLPAVAADIELIDRALTNLVDNALNASHRGGTVKLQAMLTGERIDFAVSDTGAGIAAEDLPLVTKRFYRTADGRRRGDGSGLGLAIVDEICRRHRTRLRLESRPGEGTRIGLSLPIA